MALVGGLVALAVAVPILLQDETPGGVRGLDVDSILSTRKLPPPPTLLLASPEEGEGVGPTLRVAGQAESQRGSVLDVQWRLDGGSWASLPRVVGGVRVVPFSADLPVPPGDHLLEVRAYDGDVFSLVARAAFRASPGEPAPTVRILTPTPGQGIPSGVVVVRGTLESAAPARVFVNASGHETQAEVTPGADGLAAWTATLFLPPGQHVVSAHAEGGLPRRVLVAAAPAAPPTLRIHAPAEGASFGTSGDPACPATCILFSGSAPGAREILLSLDGAPPVPLSHEAPGTYTRDAAGAWTLALPMARLLSGEHAAAFVPVAADGTHGAPQSVSFAVRGWSGVRIAGDDAPRPTHAPLRFRLEGDRVTDARWLVDGVPAGEGPEAEVRLTTPGLHAVTALARDAQGRAATARLTLHALNQAPNATLHLPEGPVSGAVALRATGEDVDGRVVSWRWDFGDGTTRATPGAATTHAYAHPGVFHVRVTPVDDHGMRGAAATGAVTVLNGGPVAAFSWTPAEPSLLDAVTFTDESVDPEGALVSVRWDFGDGSTGAGRIASHRFATRGVHEVSLTVVDADGGSATMVHEVFVRNLPPAVAFVHDPAAVHTGTEVLFRDRTVKPDGGLVSWAWDFGHECPSTPCDPIEARRANGSSVLHAFPAPGTYRVNLTVTDDLGAVATRGMDVVVANAPPAIQGVDVEPAHPKGMEPVRFRALARDAEGALVGHAWTFGDGNASTEREPTHRYARSGVYEARLRVRDGAGQVAEMSFPVVVANAKPRAVLEIPLGATAGRPAVLQANASDPDGRVVRYVFDADGDGVPECDGPAPHCLFTYPEAGAYTPTLAVADDEGASVFTDAPLSVAAPAGPTPAVTLDNPRAEEVLSGRILLTGTAEGPRGVQRVEVQLRNATGTLSASREPWMLATGDATWRLHLDTRAFPDGEYQLVVRATDARGAAGLVRVPVAVVNGPRESLVGLTLLDVPTAPLRKDHEIRGSAWHPAGPVTVRYQIDGGTWRDAPGDATRFHVPLLLPDLGPGPHVLRVDARRGLADHRSEVVEFRVAQPAPLLVVDEPPTPLAYGLLVAEGRLVGEGHVQWRLDHDVWRDLPEGPAWRLAFETYGVEGGPHTLWLRAVSQDGLEEGEPVKYRVRVINPTGKTEEDRRLLEEAMRAPAEPGAVDLEQVARERRGVPHGAAPVLLALGVAAAVAAFRPRRSRL